MDMKVSNDTARDQALDALLGKARRYAAPEGFADSVMSRLGDAESPYSNRRLRSRRWWVASAAAAVLALGAAVQVLLPSLSQPSSIAVSDVSLPDDSVLLADAMRSIGDEELVDAICTIVENNGASLSLDEFAAMEWDDSVLQ